MMEIEDAGSDPILPNHHVQQQLCETRPNYRQGRKFTAIKVYTINSESQHLYIYGVPSLNLRSELKNQAIKYGQIEYIHLVKDVFVEQFTECYHVCYKLIQSARISKRMLDNKNFYGGVLHVCYAPEFETVEQTRLKLDKRRGDVIFKTQGELPNYNLTVVNSLPSNNNNMNPQLKRKYDHSDQETHLRKKINMSSHITHSSIGPQICDFNSKAIHENKTTKHTIASINSNSSNKKEPCIPTILTNNCIKEKKIVLKNKLVKLL